jgi:CheY-like chemotaxis protein
VVLLVEPDPSARDLYRAALRDAGGFTVIPARDEIDALRRLDVSTPDAIVVNVAASETHARDFLAAIRRQRTDRIPVIAITEADPKTLDRAGFACVVAKPLDLDHLVEAILTCLAERRGQNMNA